MRILIYLLAMMTGFSAAEAARPVAAAPAAVAQRAVVAVSVASVAKKIASVSVEQRPRLAVVVLEPAQAAMPIAASSPVLRHDLTRQ